MMQYWNKSTTPGEETLILKITKFYEWVGTEVRKNPDILSCIIGGLFVDTNHTTFDYKDELLEELLRSR